MKMIALFLLVLVALTTGTSIPFEARALENLTVKLELPAGFSQSVCPAPVWKNLLLTWGKVTDQRPSTEVGLQTIKGNEVSQVMAQPPLDQIFAQALKPLLTTCGMKFTPATEGIPHLSVEIMEFSARSDKKMLVGTGEARGRLNFTIHHINETTQTVDIGFLIENKGLRKGKIKQLEKTLNELLAELLRQVPLNPTLRDLH